MDELRVTLLGTGSSGGVPRIDGDWGACDPAEPRNRRRRCAMLVQRSGPDGTTNILIDTSPDLREQLLDARINHIDAVLFTHDHADQTHGIDDIRAFALNDRRRIEAWMDVDTRRTLTDRFRYIFERVEAYPPILEVRDLPTHGTPWSIDGPGGAVRVRTFDQAHGSIRSVGYRLEGVVYSSDVSGLDATAIEAARDCDLWIVDALRWTPHPTHAHLDQALAWIAQAAPKRAVLTNLHIDMDYATVSAIVPDGVVVGYDGWTTSLPI